MLPHVRVSQARTGAALCKCLPAACGTAGELHMFVLWSSHMGGRGRARAGPDHRAPSLEPLIISLSLPLSEYLPGFFFCLCVCQPVSLLSTPPITILPFLFPFLLLLLLPGSPLAARVLQLGRGGTGGGKGGGRVRKRREEEREGGRTKEEDGSEVSTLSPSGSEPSPKHKQWPKSTPSTRAFEICAIKRRRSENCVYHCEHQKYL